MHNFDENVSNVLLSSMSFESRVIIYENNISANGPNACLSRHAYISRLMRCDCGGISKLQPADAIAFFDRYPYRWCNFNSVETFVSYYGHIVTFHISFNSRSFFIEKIRRYFCIERVWQDLCYFDQIICMMSGEILE